MKRPCRASTVLALALTLAACSVGPDFRHPVATLPAHWQHEGTIRTDAIGTGTTGEGANDRASPASPIVDGVLDPRWWDTFHDAELSSLITRVASSSLDVKAATARLMQARAARRIVGADAAPALNGIVSYQHARSSQHGVLDISGLDGEHDYNVWQPGLGASWELDLWGRVRRETEAADATVEASADLRRGVLLATLGETARAYMQLRGVQAQRRIVERNLEIARHSMALTRIRFVDGVATHLEEAQARGQVASIEAQLPMLDNRQVHLVNALSLLMATPPRTLEKELSSDTPLPPMPPYVPAGVPSELAERRPDIRTAEARLHAATANIGVAAGDFYPRVTLSANLSLQALHFGDLDSWGSRVLGVGPAMTIPLFDGGRLKGQLALREAQQQEAAVAFQRTVLDAWHEVDDAMNDYAMRQSQRNRLADAVDQNRIAFDNVQRQYLAGATDFLNVLTVQKDLLHTEQALAASSTDLMTSLVTLFTALGGGWENAFPKG